MKKYVFWASGFVVVLFILVFVFDVSYLFHGVRCTYLRGESSAQIDDSRFFYNRTVSADKPFEIPLGYNYNDSIINDSLDFVLEKSKSIAFLVVQKDSVRFEKYWGFGGSSSSTNSFSMAKSIVSLLVGCAIDRGFISSVNQSIFDFLPELKPFNGEDVKIKHLLEMSSGLDWLENYKKPISVTAKSYYGSNLEKLILNRRFISSPGKIHDYKSGDTQILGVLLERATGVSVSSFASSVLWSKIGAKHDAFWTLDYNGGIEKTFCCFNSNARDFSKLGLLVLNRGSVFGKTVVSEDYVDWISSPPLLLDVDGSDGELVDFYANGWWVANVCEKDIIYARGFNGQYVVVVPDLDLVFVRLGLFEDEKSSENNDYSLTDNLSFFIEQVIKEFS